MEKRKVIFLTLCVGGGILFSGGAFAADVSSEDQGVRRLGVTWNIAEDRRIENDGGLYQPEGLDKYMKRLVDGLSARIDRLAQENQALEGKIDQLIRQTEMIEKKIEKTPAQPAGAIPLPERPGTGP
ncbi:MAG: hypothetical protein KTQ49_07455 [Candidatus Omnitrophica bacterium]|nr:hypothetical protein [Candidatus Omnitrophota bacterium]